MPPSGTLSALFPRPSGAEESSTSWRRRSGAQQSSSIVVMPVEKTQCVVYAMPLPCLLSGTTRCNAPTESCQSSTQQPKSECLTSV